MKTVGRKMVVDYCKVVVGPRDETEWAENEESKLAQDLWGCGEFGVNMGFVVRKTPVVDCVSRSKRSQRWWLKEKRRARRRSYLED